MPPFFGPSFPRTTLLLFQAPGSSQLANSCEIAILADERLPVRSAALIQPAERHRAMANWEMGMGPRDEFDNQFKRIRCGSADANMTNVQSICRWLESQAPLSLAEDWDQVGLLLGDERCPVARLMTCLTISPTVVGEAVDEQVDMIISHHPMPFRPIGRITTSSYVGRLVWQLAKSGISVYSPHTAWDSAGSGINQQLADALALQEVAPLRPPLQNEDLGGGRFGRLRSPLSIRDIEGIIRSTTAHRHCSVVGDVQRRVQKVGIACGSGGSFLAHALQLECELLITGECNFHTCIEADGCGMNLLLIGHYASERFAMNELADRVHAKFPALEVWASHRESDPVHLI